MPDARHTRNNRLRPGLARVEFLAVRDDAEKLLDQGYTFRGAYEVLFESKKITMCYASFHRLYTGKTRHRVNSRKISVAASETVADFTPAPIDSAQTARPAQGAPRRATDNKENYSPDNFRDTVL